MKRFWCVLAAVVMVFLAGCSSNAPQGTTSSSKNPENTSSSQTSSSEETEEEPEIVESEEVAFGDFTVEKIVYEDGSRSSELEFGGNNTVIFECDKDGGYSAKLNADGSNIPVEFTLYALSSALMAEKDGFFAFFDGDNMEAYQFRDGKISMSIGNLGEKYDGFELSDDDNEKLVGLSEAFDAATEFLEE